MSSAQQRPFANLATTLLMSMSQAHGNDWMQDCHSSSAAGFNQRFEPVTFALEPGWWIAWDFKGATIAYQGQSKRVDMSLASGGTISEPLRHTELAVGLSRLTRRHFIEVPTWHLAVNPQRVAADQYAWNLGWSLYEVVGDELISIGGDGLVTVTTPEPPRLSSLDLRSLVDLRVNDNGDPEWVILNGRLPRTEVIESDTVRREDRARTEARKAADARVDWTRVRDLSRPPSFAYADADGCGNVFVYGWSADHTEAMTVRADRTLLQLSTTPTTFNLATPPNSLQVDIHVYERPVRSWPFCTDVGFGALSVEKWRAAGGTVTIELSAPGIRVRAPYLYRATIHIIGGEFVNESGVRTKQAQPVTLTAMVGSMGG